MSTQMRLAALRRVFTTVAVLAVAIVAVPAPATAQGHRARLSSDLSERLRQRVEGATEVIVSVKDSDIDSLVARYGMRLKKRLRGGAVIEATGGQIDAMSQDADVDHIAGDARVYRMMAVTTQATGADQVWGGLTGLRGLTGRGIGVAVIDSGVAPHSALRGAVVVAEDFTDQRGKGKAGRDEYGHGTHVAGIIAEKGTAGHIGMAPGVSILNLKVLNADGSGKTSDVIEAIDWAIAHRAAYNIRIINLSLGHPVFESYRDDPLCQAAQRAVDAGILVVAAAGNFGKTDDGRPVVGGIIAPGNTPSVLTVGALNTRGTVVRSDDVMATYSSRGPTAIDGVLKPELAAPGNRIVATSAADGYLARTYPERVIGHGAASYFEMSGTSMSAAVVSGAAALVLEARPSLTPAQVKATLQLTSSRVAGAGLIEAGAGSVNVAAAVRLAE
ncbi:MAG: S8 family peptidase, partial [Vicinamibacterales bacterium]